MNSQTVSLKAIWFTWVSLMVLLGLTWLVAQFDLGAGNTFIALLISGVKMMLVILFFMQVRYSSRLVWIFAGAGFIWFLILIILTFSDFFTRQTVIPYVK